jgi:hypothetical protein
MARSWDKISINAFLTQGIYSNFSHSLTIKLDIRAICCWLKGERRREIIIFFFKI